MATHSSILVWEIPWTEEPDRLQSMGLQRLGHDLTTEQQQHPHWNGQNLEYRHHRLQGGCGPTGTHHCWWECKVVQPLWKMVWWFLAKADKLIPRDPAVVLLGIYPKELKTYVPGKTSTRMFIKALFKIANTWKQPRCPSVGGWIVKSWSIQTMGYYSTLSCSTNRQGGLFNTGKK